MGVTGISTPARVTARVPEIEREIRHAQDRRRDEAAPATNERVQARLQLLDLERLDQVVVRARLETLDLVVERIARGQHENGRIAPRILAQAPAKLHAVDSGKNQVEHDRVPFAGHGEVKPRHAVARVVHEVAAPFEKRVDHLRDVPAVLDDQDGLTAL